MSPSEITSKTVNVILSILFCLPLLAFAHNAFTNLNNFASYGHDLILAIFQHVIDRSLFYTAPLVLVLVYAGFRNYQTARDKDSNKQWSDKLRFWQTKAEQNRAEGDAHATRYNSLKKHISEMVTPCGQIIFNADDTVSIQHLFCKEYQKQESIISEMRNGHAQRFKENVRLRSEIFKLRSQNDQLRWRKSIKATPEYIEMLKSKMIQTKDDRLEQLEQALSGYKDEARELRYNLNESRKTNDALKKTEQDLKSKISVLSATNKIRKPSQVDKTRITIEKLENELSETKAKVIQSEQDFEDLLEQYEAIDLDRTKYQSELEAAMKCKSSLERQISDSAKALQDKTSEVEQVRESAKNEVKSVQKKSHGVVNRLRKKIMATKVSRKNSLPAPTSVIDNSQAIAEARKAAKAEFQAALDQMKHQHEEQIAAKNSEIEALEETKKQHLKQVAIKNSEVKTLQARVITNADVRSSDEYQQVLTAGKEVQQKYDQLASTLNQYPALEEIKKAEESFAKLKNDNAQLQRLYDEEIDKVTARDIELEMKNNELKTKDQEIMNKDRIISVHEQIRDSQHEKIEQKDKIIGDMFKSPTQSVTSNDLTAEIEHLKNVIISKDKTIRDLHERESQTPLLNNPVAELQILHGAIAGKDARIAILERRNQLAEDGERATREQLDMARASYKRADAIREECKDAHRKLNELKASLRNREDALYDMEDTQDEIESKLIGMGFNAPGQSILQRLQACFNYMNSVRMASHCIPEVLDEENLAIIDPDTGKPFETLKHRIQYLVEELLELRDSAAVATTKQNVENTQLLTEIDRQLNMANISDPQQPLLQRVKFAIISAQDQSDTLQVLHNEGLFRNDLSFDLRNQIQALVHMFKTQRNPEDPYNILQILRDANLLSNHHSEDVRFQIGFLISEHNRHKGAATHYYGQYDAITSQLSKPTLEKKNLEKKTAEDKDYVEIEGTLARVHFLVARYQAMIVELNKRFGSPRRDDGDTPLYRVKWLIALPENRKGIIRDQF